VNGSIICENPKWDSPNFLVESETEISLIVIVILFITLTVAGYPLVAKWLGYFRNGRVGEVAA
jgi:hypothetical protein